MPPASKTESRTVTNTALPYISNSSVTSTSPQFVPGSQNIMTSLREWSENRPGFSQAFDTTLFNNLQRNFVWSRWTGSTPNGGRFIAMYCDISGTAKVYKKIIGVDANPVLIWTSSTAEPFDFVVSNNTCYFGNGTDMKKFDSVTVTNWGIAGPVAGPTLALVGGTMNVFTSWCYVYTYFNSNTQHESSPSPVSVCSGVFAASNVSLGVVASTDPQVTNIRVYRTPDGGAADPVLMQEISNSPFTNTTGTVTDSTLDVNLSIRTAPEFFRNNPPTPSKGFVTYGGRIWGFINNTVYYSGFEEIANGVPEESWPGGLSGNFYPYATEVFAVASLIDGISVFEAERIGKIEGDTLDTFRRYTLLEKRGTRSRTTVVSLGGSVVWFDTSNTVWLSDAGELSIPIRPDLAPINPQTCWITIHISGIFHWVVVLDGANGVLYVYDLDRHQWMPPWTLGAPASALYSGESATGVVNLFLARNKTKILTLASGTYTDDGNAYIPIVKTNLYSLTPDGYDSWQGTHDWSEIKVDTPPTQILQLTDDDPDRAAYTDITANAELSPLLAASNPPLKFLQSWRYPAPPTAAAFMSMQFIWPGGVNFHLYKMTESFHPAGG
jgi:hypothetical protein